jgi:pimeloyl-ACP methyl ester carboxylesterase
MQKLSLEGSTVFFKDEGRGPPVLLLHGFPLTGKSFHLQVQALKEHFRFIVPDHRGFGESTLSDEPTAMSRMAQDALAILDALGIPSAVIGGVSMGGYVSMALLREDPSRVKGLVLVDTHPYADDEAGKELREKNAQAVLQQGMPFLVESMMPRLLSPEAPVAARAEVEALILSNNPKGAAAALRGMALRGDSQDILARYAGPALVAVGEKDAITPKDKAKRLAQLLHHSRWVELPGVGHLSNQEAPEAFNAELFAFLKQF